MLTHLNNYTKPYVNLLFGLVGIYNFGGVLVNLTEGYFQVYGYRPTMGRIAYMYLNNYTRAYVSFLFGLLGTYNFGGVLVNPTEGYFQVNGYSFSSPAKNDVSE